MTYHVLQVNLGTNRATKDALEKCLIRQKVDMAAIQEVPGFSNKSSPKINGFEYIENKHAGIYIKNGTIHHVKKVTINHVIIPWLHSCQCLYVTKRKI